MGAAPFFVHVPRRQTNSKREGANAMKIYPVSLTLSGKLCTVVGGGSVAERKTVGLLACESRVRVVSPAVTRHLHTLAEERRIEWVRKAYGSTDLEGSFLVFAATNNMQAQEAVLRDAREAGILVNIADAPDACDFHVPASIHRGDLVVSISTSGKSPAVAAMIRRQLEGKLGPEYAQLVELMAMVRLRVLATAGDQNDKKNVFRSMLHEDILEWLRAGDWDRIREHLESQLGQPLGDDLSRLRKEV